MEWREDEGEIKKENEVFFLRKRKENEKKKLFINRFEFSKYSY